MIAQFSLRLICGMSLMWSVMPRRRVTAGFFRIQMLVALGLSALGGLTFGDFARQSEQPLLVSSTLGSLLCSLLALAAFIGSVLWTLDRRSGGITCIFLVAGASTCLLLLTALPVVPGNFWTVALNLASELTTAALLGGIVTTMLLGHWYLTAPSMSLEPLRRLIVFLAGAGVLRLVLSAMCLWIAWSEIGGQTYWTWLSLRWLAGIAGPLVVCGMVWRILKYHNTQAATGVLFAGVVLSFIGELSAALLSSELLMPL